MQDAVDPHDGGVHVGIGQQQGEHDEGDGHVDGGRAAEEVKHGGGRAPPCKAAQPRATIAIRLLWIVK